MSSISRTSLDKAIARLIELSSPPRLVALIEKWFGDRITIHNSVELRVEDIALGLSEAVVTYLGERAKADQLRRGARLRAFTYIFVTATVFILAILFLSINFSNEMLVISLVQIAFTLLSFGVNIGTCFYITQLRRDTFFSQWPVYPILVEIMLLGFMHTVMGRYSLGGSQPFELFTAHMIVLLWVVYIRIVALSDVRVAKRNNEAVSYAIAFLACLGIKKGTGDLSGSSTILRYNLQVDELMKEFKQLIPS